VLLLVHVAIVLHVLHWQSAGETLGPLEPSEGITFSQNSVISPGFVFFVVAILATFFFGRFFCGWACHLLALQDACLWLLKKVGLKPKPRQMKSRILLVVPMIACVYMFLYPIGYRLWTGRGFEKPTTEFIVEDFWATFPPWPVAVATLLVAGFAIVYFLGAKGFCTNVCPYGAAFGVADRVSPARIRVTDACEGCGHCTQVCTSNVVVHSEVRDYGMVVDQECMKCLDCVSVCPKDALYFGFGRPALFSKPHRSKKPKRASEWWKINRWKSYGWGEEIAVGALFALAFFTFRGLYNTIPFLFALSIAAILAYLALQTLRLFYKPAVQLQRIDLKRAGGLTTAGRTYALSMVVLVAFWAQSAYVHYHRAQAEAGFLELNEVVTGWFRAPRELSEEEQTLVTNTLEHTRVARGLTPLSLFPGEEWELCLTSGWLHLLQGDEERFQLELERAADVLPDDYVACDGLANFHAAAGRAEEADRWFERATRAEPERPEVWANWSNHLLATGRTDEALAVLEEAASTPGVELQAGMMLAGLELGRGSLPEAARAYEAVLEHEPGTLEARLSLAGILRDLEDYGRSVEQYERALADGAEGYDLRLATTLSCSLAQDLGRAEHHAGIARDLAPERPEAWFALHQIALQSGREEDAMRFLAEAQQRAPQAPTDSPSTP